MEGILFILLSFVTLLSLLVLLGILFPKRIEAMGIAATDLPGRSFVLGLVNTLFFGAIILGFVALADSSGVQLIAILAVLILAGFAVVLLLGLASMTNLVGNRIAGDMSYRRRVIFGGSTLILACLAPFVGWFLFFPYIGMLGVGAFVLTIFRTRQSPSETSEES
jgi:hypothetical protein